MSVETTAQRVFFHALLEFHVQTLTLSEIIDLLHQSIFFCIHARR